MSILYRSIADRVSTDEARDLAARLANWHDAMVMHERRQRLLGGRASCSDECPHAFATALWREAERTFGPAANDLQFLRSRALAAGAHLPPGGPLLVA